MFDNSAISLDVASAAGGYSGNTQEVLLLEIARQLETISTHLKTIADWAYEQH